MKFTPSTLFIFAVLCLCRLLMSPVEAAGLCQGIAIPAYFYPGTLWKTAISSSPRTAIMIMNPDSGVGYSKDTNYVNTVISAQASGIKVLGYVYTGYGLRPMQEVKNEINAYKSWYGVDGIFLDEVDAISAYFSYYKTLANYIRASKGGFVMINPGTVPDDPRYVRLVADTTVIFEDSYSAYLAWTPPTWIYNYPAGKFAHLVYNTSSTQMANAIALSRNKNAGLIYITNDILNNPWNTLPSYWTTEINTMTSKCAP